MCKRAKWYKQVALQNFIDARDGPNWGREVLFPTNPDLADILGRTDFDFEIFQFLDFLEASNG